MSTWDEYKKTMVAAPNLLAAVKAEDGTELTRLLDAGADIDEKDHRGYSALMMAAYGGHAGPFELLLARGADPSTADLAGNTVLMGAAFKGHGAMVRKLLAAGADRTAKNAAGLDARAFALMFGRTEMVELLDSTDPRMATENVHV